MNHGSEHKCINCIEHGLERNVKNVRKSSKQHKRFGTSFLFFVMIVSIIFCFFIAAESQVLRVVIRIALLPLIAGVSYDIISLPGFRDCAVINLLATWGTGAQCLVIQRPSARKRDTHFVAEPPPRAVTLPPPPRQRHVSRYGCSVSLRHSRCE